VALLALGNLWSTFHRSGIPVALTGRVERVEVRREKHPGLDDVHLVTISGRRIHLDADVAALVQEGDEVRKPAWSTHLTTPRGTSRIGLSRDFRRMIVAMPVAFVLALLLLGYGTPRQRGSPPEVGG
jgi:hypothetical protein